MKKDIFYSFYKETFSILPAPYGNIAKLYISPLYYGLYIDYRTCMLQIIIVNPLLTRKDLVKLTSDKYHSITTRLMKVLMRSILMECIYAN